MKRYFLDLLYTQNKSQLDTSFLLLLQANCVFQKVKIGECDKVPNNFISLELLQWQNPMGNQN